MPISQIVDFPRRPQNDQPRDAAQEIAEKLQPFVGRKLRLKILEVNRKANRLILSEKVALYEERREKRDELFSSLQVGQKVKGTVRSIAPFGVFIDLGGIDGLVHKSELSWNKVNNPEAGYNVGEEVEAEVIDINHERGRISLSIRRLQPDPWHSTVADFKVGDIIDGTVTKLVNFGAFVRVRDGLEGLIHISELSHQRVAHPGDVVHEGQTLKLKIISLDSERHRLGLSLKQAEEPPARPAAEPEAAPRRRHAPERGERRPRRSAATRWPTRSRSPRAASTTRWPRPSPRSASRWPPRRSARSPRPTAAAEAAEEAAEPPRRSRRSAEAVADAEAAEEAAAAEADRGDRREPWPPTKSAIEAEAAAAETEQSADAAGGERRRTKRRPPRRPVEVAEAVAEAAEAPRKRRPPRAVAGDSPRTSPPTRPPRRRPTAAEADRGDRRDRRRGRGRRIAGRRPPRRSPRSPRRPRRRTPRRTDRLARDRYGPLGLRRVVSIPAPPSHIRCRRRDPYGRVRRRGPRRVAVAGRRASMAASATSVTPEGNRRSTRWIASTSSRTARARS